MKFLIIILALFKLVTSQKALIEAQVKTEAFRVQINADIISDVERFLTVVKKDVEEASSFFAENNFISFTKQFNDVKTLIDQISSREDIGKKLDEAFEIYRATVVEMYQKAAVGIQESACKNIIARPLTAFLNNVQKNVTRVARSLRKEYENEVKAKRKMLMNAFELAQNKIEACNARKGAKSLACKANIIEDSGPRVSSYIALVKQLVPQLINQYFADIKQQLDTIAESLEPGLEAALNVACEQ